MQSSQGKFVLKRTLHPSYKNIKTKMLIAKSLLSAGFLLTVAYCIYNTLA